MNDDLDIMELNDYDDILPYGMSIIEYADIIGLTDEVIEDILEGVEY